PLLARMELTILTPSRSILMVTSAHASDITFVSCYLPHASRRAIREPDAEEATSPHQQQLTVLSTELAKLSTTPIVAGDMNAVLPPGVTGPFGYTGRLGTDARAASLELQLFTATRQLRSASQCSPTHPTFFGKFS